MNYHDILNKLAARQLESRIVFLDSSIDDNVARDIISTLLFYDSESGNKPITMYINSPGGSVQDGLAIIDCMNLIRSEVHTFVIGQAASMAAIILIAGNYRQATDSSVVMFHELSYGFNSTKLSDTRVFAKYAEYMANKMQSIIESKTKIDYSAIETGKDLYFWSDELIKNGIVDEIVVNKEKLQ
jgi:ATP-dependent Clp protease protease subunit